MYSFFLDSMDCEKSIDEHSFKPLSQISRLMVAILNPLLGLVLL